MQEWLKEWISMRKIHVERTNTRDVDDNELNISSAFTLVVDGMARVSLCLFSVKQLCLQHLFGFVHS